jgi:RNA polymerase sigma-70 factor (ECF subfamily)
MADPTQIAELYRTYGPAIYQRCLRMLRSRDAAADATQEVFARLSRDIGRLASREHALAWIYRTAMHHCLNTLRNTARRGDEPLLPELEVRADGSADLYPARELAQRVLARFDETTQVIAVGVLVDGMHQLELARMLDLSEKTVARRLRRFLEEARALLAEAER